MSTDLGVLFDVELKEKFGAHYADLPSKADIVGKGFATVSALNADATKRGQLFEELKLPTPVASWLEERLMAEKKKEEAPANTSSSQSYGALGSVGRYTSWSDDDLKTYRDGYPQIRDNPAINDNLSFYSETLRSRPNNLLISEFHTSKRGQYDFLEREHGYIQWLFPIQEHGMNYESVPLQKHEIETMRTNPLIVNRIVESYKLMLDFFGMCLKDATTGEIGRSENFEARYKNLDWSSHNYLRITRILKCLGEMGLEHFKKHWLMFFIQEVYEHKELTNTASSLDRYWLGTLRDDKERAEVRAFHDEMKKKYPLPVKQYGMGYYW